MVGSWLRWGIAMGCLLGSMGMAFGEEKAPWRVGVGVERITPVPPKGQWLAGLGDPEDKRISEGVHDDIYCRALALSDGKTTVVLAVCDLIGLFHHDILDIRSRVKGIPPENILIGCTHVHSAPDTLGLWGPARDKSGVDPRYLDFLKRQAARAIQQAVDTLEPARLRFARAWSPPKTSRNFNDPEIKDDEISLLQALRPNGQVIATLVNWACHPEVLWTDNRLITSDYVHFLREAVEKAQGGVALFFNGALGGMVSPDNEGRHTFAEAQRIGQAVAQAVNAALQGAEEAPEALLRLGRSVFTIPVQNPGLEPLLRLGVLRRGPEESPDAVQTEVYALQVGPAQFATLPGEALPAVGFLVKTMMDGKYKFLLGLTMDELGYLLPETAINMEKYAYEQSMSVNPHAVEFILPQVRKALDEVKPKR